MLITKADGTVEEFKENKLKGSLRRAGATKEEIEKVVQSVTATMV